MKKSLWLLALAIFSEWSFADHGITVGGGGNLSSTNQDEEGVTYSRYLNFNGGIGFETGITPMFSLATELNLETRGAVAEAEMLDPVTNTTIETKSTLKMMYLQVPIFTVLNFPMGAVTFNVFGGPALGYVLSNEIEFKVGEADTVVDFMDDTKTVDFGVELGAGIELPVGPIGLFVRPSYYLGLLNVDDSESESGEEEADLKLRSIKVKAGIRINLPM